MVTLEKWESKWVESRIEETVEWMNFSLYRLAKSAAEGGHILNPYSDDEARAWLTRVVVKVRSEGER